MADIMVTIFLWAQHECLLVGESPSRGLIKIPLFLHNVRMFEIYLGNIALLKKNSRYCREYPELSI